MNRDYISRALRLTLLAPDIIGNDTGIAGRDARLEVKLSGDRTRAHFLSAERAGRL